MEKNVCGQCLYIPLSQLLQKILHGPLPQQGVAFVPSAQKSLKVASGLQDSDLTKPRNAIKAKAEMIEPCILVKSLLGYCVVVEMCLRRRTRALKHLLLSL